MTQFCSQIRNKQTGSTQKADEIKKVCGSLFIIPGDTRWNEEFDSCNDCVKKIDNSSDQLESLMTFLKLKKFTDVEIRGLREYAAKYGLKSVKKSSD